MNKAKPQQTLHHHTPLLYSHPLSKLTQRDIYLKCESLQPSGSFKDRGIGNLCQHYANLNVPGFVCSSGGNAGLAVAYASQVLQIPAVIVIPKCTPAHLIARIQAEPVEVIIDGEDWNSADKMAQQLVEERGFAYIPPFNHWAIWQGYTSIIDELQEDQVKPDAILLSVGGGGLLCGITQGLHDIGWHHIPIITAETSGAATLALSMKAHERIYLDKLNTVAVTLAARQVCEQAFEWTQKHRILPQVVADKAAIEACYRFSDDHHLLVEPSCGAALAILYHQLPVIKEFNSIAVIICGGSAVNIDLLNQWMTQFEINR